MESYKYFVFLNDEKIAEFEELCYALMLVKGIYNEYYNESVLDVRIERSIEEVEVK